MDVRKLAKLKTGDIILIDKPRLIDATIEDIPLIKGSYGQSNGMVSFKVDSFLKISSAALDNSTALAPRPTDAISTQATGVGTDTNASST